MLVNNFVDWGNGQSFVLPVKHVSGYMALDVSLGLRRQCCIIMLERSKMACFWSLVVMFKYAVNCDLLPSPRSIHCQIKPHASSLRSDVLHQAFQAMSLSYLFLMSSNWGISLWEACHFCAIGRVTHLNECYATKVFSPNVKRKSV